MSGELLRVDVGDLTFDVRVDGPDDGRPVLLLHGFPETSLSWAAVTPRLAEAGLRTAREHVWSARLPELERFYRELAPAAAPAG